MATRTSRSFRALVLVIATTALTVGCAGETETRPQGSATPSSSPSTSAAREFADLPTPEILEHGLAALTDVDTLRVQFTAEGTYFLQIDLRRAENGDCIGTQSVDGIPTSQILTEDYQYVRGSARYWRQADIPGASDQMLKRPHLWARFPANEFLLGVCRATDLFKTLQIPRKELHALEASSPFPSTGGRTVVSLTDAYSDLKVEVDVEEPHYLVKIDGYGGRTVFSDFGSPVTVTKPGRDGFVAFMTDETST